MTFSSPPPIEIERMWKTRANGDDSLSPYDALVDDSGIHGRTTVVDPSDQGRAGTATIHKRGEGTIAAAAGNVAYSDGASAAKNPQAPDKSKHNCPAAIFDRGDDAAATFFSLSEVPLPDDDGYAVSTSTTTMLRVRTGESLPSLLSRTKRPEIIGRSSSEPRAMTAMTCDWNPNLFGEEAGPRSDHRDHQDRRNDSLGDHHRNHSDPTLDRLVAEIFDSGGAHGSFGSEGWASPAPLASVAPPRQKRKLSIASKDAVLDLHGDGVWDEGSALARVLDDAGRDDCYYGWHSPAPTMQTSPPFASTSTGWRRSSSLPLLSEIQTNRPEFAELFKVDVGLSNCTGERSKNPAGVPHGASASYRGHNDENEEEGLSEEDERRLEAMGIYSREKPKRRRSSPLLVQVDLPKELAMNATDDGSIGVASRPQHVTKPAPPLSPNADLIRMLMGENCVDHEPTDPTEQHPEPVATVMPLPPLPCKLPLMPQQPQLSPNCASPTEQHPEPVATVMTPPLLQRQLPLMPQQPQLSTNCESRTTRHMQTPELANAYTAQYHVPLNDGPSTTVPMAHLHSPLKSGFVPQIVHLPRSRGMPPQQVPTIDAPPALTLGACPVPKRVEKAAKVAPLTAAPSPRRTRPDTVEGLCSQPAMQLERPSQVGATGIGRLDAGSSRAAEHSPARFVGDAGVFVANNPDNEEGSSPASVATEVGIEVLPPQNKNDAGVIMKRLQGLMDKTVMSQERLQKWDTDNGLPKSHSQTMVKSGRSREQLRGVVLKKWNGTSLITPPAANKEESAMAQEKNGPSHEELKWQTNDEEKNGKLGKGEDTSSAAAAIPGTSDGALIAGSKRTTAYSHMKPIWALGKFTSAYRGPQLNTKETPT